MTRIPKSRWGRAALPVALAGLSIQTGAQFFAVSVIVTTLTSSVPESLSMTAGEFGYDSSGFWGVAPNVNAILLVLALALNWRTPQRTLVSLSVAGFVVSGVIAVAFVEPLQAALLDATQIGATQTDLQASADRWLRMDWLAWSLGAVSWFFMLLASLSAWSGRPDADPVGAR